MRNLFNFVINEKRHSSCIGDKFKEAVFVHYKTLDAGYIFIRSSQKQKLCTVSANTTLLIEDFSMTVDT